MIPGRTDSENGHLEVLETSADTRPAIVEIKTRLGEERGVIIQMDQVPADVKSLYGM